MTDETDISTEEADSGRSSDEKLNAEVIATSGPAGDPDVYLVEYADGEQVYEPATPTNVALFEDGLFTQVQGHSEFEQTSTGITVELDADVLNRTYVLTVDGNEIPVPADRIESILNAFQSGSTGSNLYSVYEDIIEGQVRRHAVERFIDRFPEERVEQTPEGWVVDETFVVTYEGTNHLTDLDPTDPYGNETDESKQAVYLDINASENREIMAPDGERVELTPLEQEFITQVEGLLYPEDYFGVELVDCSTT